MLRVNLAWLCAGAYITSDNALHAPKSGLATLAKL